MSFLDFYKFMALIKKVPKTLIMNDRLKNDLILIHNFTKTNDKEVGGYLIKNANGHLGVIGVQLGEDREVNIRPNEELQPREEFLGTFHSHPITNWQSVHDVATFLADDSVVVDGNTGVDGSFNLLIKTPNTKSISMDAIEKIKEEYKQEDIPRMADEYGFLFYRGKIKDGKIELFNEKLNGSGKANLDDFLKNVKGLKEIPVEATKKVRKRYGRKR